MIKIRSPRYRDHVVLLAVYHLIPGNDIDIKIEHGAYKGVYHITNEAICESPIEPMTTKRGKQIAMRAVSLDKMERVK